MSKVLTSLQIGRFLSNFEKYATVEIIEGSKETNEIVQIAKAKGIDLKNNRDLSGFKAIYGFADKPNYNKDMVPEPELLKSLPSIISKPINISHERRYVIGHIIDYRYQQNTKKIIVYGVIYKSNFGTEWKRAKREFEDGNLGVSWEIHSPDDKRVELPNGVFELNDIEHAGMALLFRDDEDPAEAEATVLSMARKQMDESKDLDLVFASKYKDSDILTADIYKEQVEKNLVELNEQEAKDKEWEQLAEMTKKEKPEIIDVKVLDKKGNPIKIEEKSEVTEPKEVIEPKEPEAITNPKIKCSGCEEEFEVINGQLEYKCPKCLSILDSKGTVKYPPQIKDFRLSCPSCSYGDWLILKNEEDKTTLKCKNEICNKNYEVEFAQAVKNELLEKTRFLYTNTVTCIQCGKSIDISGTSKAEVHEVKCPKCKLVFEYNVTKANKDRQITKITEIVIDDSEKGGDEDVKIPKEIVEQVKEDNKEKPEVKVEEKVEAPKVEEKPTEVVKEKKEEIKEPVEKVEESVAEKPESKASVEPTPEEVIEPKTVSTVRKAVKKIMTLKKDLRTAKKEKEEKEITLKTAIKKVASQLIKANAEIKKIKEEADEKIELYKTNAKTILKRREELGEKFVGDLSDKDILNEDKFKTASLEKEVTLLKASKEITDEIVGDKTDEDENSEDTKLSEEIDKKAFTKEKEGK